MDSKPQDRAETCVKHDTFISLHLFGMDRATLGEDVREVSPRAIKIIILCVIFLALATTAVGLRIWARRIKGSLLCLNDYTILAALVGDCHHERYIGSANAHVWEGF